MRETRLYYKGAHQQAYECFETVRLATDAALLTRFLFLLGAERVVPAHRDCHLYELLRASETVGRALTNQFYALYADIRQRVLTRLCRENAAIAPPEILRCTQKLLDRVLFCAFCECRGLLPAETLKHAFEHRDPYNPRPVWLNFRGLFRAIDEGNAGLNIPAYNGGLFALDPSLDALQVPDEVCAQFKELGDYDYRPAREVADPAEGTAVRSVIDVDILGHIFEQSITDLQRCVTSCRPTVSRRMTARPAAGASGREGSIPPALSLANLSNRPCTHPRGADFPVSARRLRQMLQLRFALLHEYPNALQSVAFLQAWVRHCGVGKFRTFLSQVSSCHSCKGGIFLQGPDQVFPARAAHICVFAFGPEQQQDIH